VIIALFSGAWERMPALAVGAASALAVGLRQLFAAGAVFFPGAASRGRCRRSFMHAIFGVAAVGA